MTAVALGLLAALALGASDFAGGLLSRSLSPWAVAATAHAVAFAVTVAAALLAAGSPGTADLAWGAAAGVGEGVGIAFLFRGLGRGQMGVVAPISGVGATLVPVVIGVATGDQPSALAWTGILLAFPAVYLIPRGGTQPGGRGQRSGAVLDGVLAGLGFGAQLALVAQIGERSGFAPLAALWLLSALTIVALATGMHESWRPRRARLPAVVGVGLLSAGALVAYLLATREGLLTVVSVVTALYPAATVLLATLVLRERIGRLQAVGLALTVTTVVLVSLG